MRICLVQCVLEREISWMSMDFDIANLHESGQFMDCSFVMIDFVLLLYNLLDLHQ